MKSRMIATLTGMLLMVSSPALSQDISFEMDWSRWSGRVEYGVMGVSTTSRVLGLEPDDGLGIDSQYPRIDSLGKNRSYETFVTSFFLFDVNYMLSPTTTLYIGTPFSDDDREGLTLGVQKLFENNCLLDMSLFFKGETLWEDPYLTGVKRETTESGILGLVADYDGIFGTELNINYMFQGRTVEDDISGRHNAALDREGISHTFKTGYNFFLGERFDTVLNTSLILKRDDREGGAYANNGVGMAFTFSMEEGENEIYLNTFLGKNLYDDVHPLFGERRSEKAYKVECYYTRKHLWDRNWYVRFGGGFHKTDANIGFFDEDKIFTVISIGYSFE